MWKKISNRISRLEEEGCGSGYQAIHESPHHFQNEEFELNNTNSNSICRGESDDREKEKNSPRKIHLNRMSTNDETTLLHNNLKSISDKSQLRDLSNSVEYHHDVSNSYNSSLNMNSSASCFDREKQQLRSSIETTTGAFHPSNQSIPYFSSPSSSSSWKDKSTSSNKKKSVPRPQPLASSSINSGNDQQHHFSVHSSKIRNKVNINPIHSKSTRAAIIQDPSAKKNHYHHMTERSNRYSRIMSSLPPSMSFSSSSSSSSIPSSIPSSSSSSRNTRGSSIINTSHQNLPQLPRLSKGLPSFQHPALMSSSSSSSSTSVSMSSTSMYSGSLPNPSLNNNVNDNENNHNHYNNIWMNKPPRTNWNVADNKLKPIPPLYPPIPPNNKIFITDSSPSIVACRISECLRKRSIIADYDDEAAMATCWSKGDNGSGEGELLLLHTGAVATMKKHGQKNHKISDVQNYVISGNTRTSCLDDNSDDDYNDNGISSNGLTNNNYGGGGGCVVFVIHLYRGGTALIDPMNRSNSGDTAADDKDGFLPSSSTVTTTSGYNYPYTNQKSYSFPSTTSSVISSSSSHASNNMSKSTRQGMNLDLSHGIIVECMRIRGNTIQFYKDCKAVFAAARGDSDGLDDYRSSKSQLYQSPFCFERSRSMHNSKHGNFTCFRDDDDSNLDNVSKNEEGLDTGSIATDFAQIKLRRSPSKISKTTFSALERVFDLFQTDQLDTQLLGVKSLTLLTDAKSSGIESSFITSLCILGSKVNNVLAGKIHRIVYVVLMGQSTSLVSATDEEDNNEELIDFSHPYSTLYSSRSRRLQELPENKLNSIASQYHSTIRGYMMNVLTNALGNVIKHKYLFADLCYDKPTCMIFMKRAFLDKISEDIAGATRPPTASFGTAHEATHAVKFLHLMSSYSEEGFDAIHRTFVGYGSRTERRPLMESLERACESGLSSHHVLKVEAKIARNILRGRACSNQSTL